MYCPLIIEKRGVTSHNLGSKILSNDDDNGNENGQFVLSWQRDVTTCNVLLARACASNIFCRQKCLRPLLSGTVALVKSDAKSKSTSKCFHLLQNQASSEVSVPSFTLNDANEPTSLQLCVSLLHDRFLNIPIFIAFNFIFISIIA